MLESVMEAVGKFPEVMRVVGNRMYDQFGDVEMYTLIAIGIIFFVWLVGSSQNKKIAHKQFQYIEQILGGQFSKPGSKMVRESNSHFFIYSTGRANCSGMSTSIHLAPRQDFLSRFVLRWVWPSMYLPDRVIIEVYTDAIDDAVTSVLCRKFEAKKISEKFPEIANFLKPANQCIEGSAWARNASSLTGFTHMANPGGKAVGSLVFGKNLSAQVDLVQFLSISDKTVRVELNRLPSHWDEWEGVYTLVLSGVLDVLAPLRVTDAVRAEVAAQRSADEIKRKAAEDAEAKEAALAKRQAEKRREQEEMLRKMSPEAVRKMEEKEKKRNMKKRAGKGIVM